VAVSMLALTMVVPGLLSLKQLRIDLLPHLIYPNVRVGIKGDIGMQLDEMDTTVRKIEALLQAQPEVKTVYTQAGGFVYGRAHWIASNRSTLSIQLVSPEQRNISTEEWVHRMRETFQKLDLAGFRLNIWARGRIRGIRLGRGEDDISLRIAGPDLATLIRLG
jgi:multidrug efflux pump subunit AcrB